MQIFMYLSSATFRIFANSFLLVHGILSLHIADWYERLTVNKPKLLTLAVPFFYMFVIYCPLLLNPFSKPVFDYCADTSLNYATINIDMCSIPIVILNTLYHLIELLYFKYSLSFIFWSLDFLDLFYKLIGDFLYSLISHVRADNIFIAFLDCFEFETKKFRIATFEIYNLTFLF